MTDTITAPAWAQRSTDLSGKTVLVVGGAGGVGEGVTRALLAGGATVIATARTRAKLDDLADRVDDPHLLVRPLDVMSDDLGKDVGELLDEHGPLDGVAVLVADWGAQGRKNLLDHTDEEWEALVAANQTSILRAYRALVPAIKPSGMIAQLNGFSADIPFPGAGGVAATAAATKSMTRTIAEEVGGRGPRVYEVILGVVRTRPRQLAGVDDPGWIPAADVGFHVAELVAGNAPLAGTVLHYFVDPASGPRPTPPAQS